MFDVYDSSEIGWLVVFVARNSAVSLDSESTRDDWTNRLIAVLHDVLGMPVHHRVLEVETFQVGYSSRLDFFGEVEVATQLRYLADIQFDEEELLVSVEEMDI